MGWYSTTLFPTNLCEDYVAETGQAEFFDAMLAAEKDLRGATVDDWTRILVDSCRQQKDDVDDRQLVLLAGC